MKLRWQIGVIAILSLSFPWVVWLAFKSLNQTFQENMLNAAAKQAGLIVSAVQQFNQDRPESLAGLVATELGDEVAIDGNSAEWNTLPWYHLDPRLRFKLGRHQQAHHLLIEVVDDSLYLSPDGTADRIILATGEARGINKYVINRQAEGPVSTAFGDTSYQAHWHEVANGYQVEIRLNTPALNRMGLAVINHATADSSVTFGINQGGQIQLQPLFTASDEWQSFLQKLTPEDGEIVVKDSQGRRLYRSSNQPGVVYDTDWLTELIYELAFDQNQADDSHFFGQRVTRGFAAGQIDLTVNHTQAQRELIQTFIRSMLLILGIALVLLAGYFIYALILAWRIKHLNQNLQTALDDHGHINTTLPSAKARDEIGDLSRGMSALLAKINDYTEYLKQLGSRLSHEMKTPISIVHTSLENLQMEQSDNPFVQRALDANHRLKFILNQLSALSQLKQVISDTDKEPFDLNQLLADLVRGYRLQATHIEYHGTEQPVMIHGSQELKAQMIDKLVQNALDFTTPEEQIRLELATEAGQYTLKVINTGSQIPADKLHQLFDSLTSFRERSGEEPHLGLGLYIAKLICDYHQAEITAENQAAPTAVAFVIAGAVFTK
ncbi:ATP-binding protein [Marinicella meishanensis]|uniref:ATP-binding protein n=1 Tax=Marinicella meishanensis TaxID=2873263 RepID=UPI001CBDFFE3|nr:ATP-binding protein [Marinicella sp. NBU2979]